MKSKKNLMGMFLALAASVALVRPAGAAMFGNLEAPGTYGSQIANVQGWVYTTTPGAELIQPFDVEIDGVKVMEVPCCSSRGDVQDEHPEAPLQTGFSGVLNWAREALAADGPVTVTVTARDTAGGEIVLESVVDLYALASFPFVRMTRFDFDGDLKARCRPSNVVGPDETLVAELRCTSLAATNGDRSVVETCAGETRFTWDRGSQGFKQTSFCEPLDRWTDHGDGTATDNVTGLMWELKTGDPSELRHCPLVVGPTECADLHDIGNAFQWSADGAEPTGSAFSRQLTLLNRAVSPDGVTSTGCFAGHCDWRMPTLAEAARTFGPCDSGPCDEIPGAPMTYFWTSSSKANPAEAYWLVSGFGVQSEEKTAFLPVRAVRGRQVREDR